MTSVQSYQKNVSAHYFDPEETPDLHVYRNIFKDTYHEMKNLMKTYKLKKEIQEALMGAMQTKWQYLHRILRPDNFNILPNESILQEIKVDMFTSTLRNVPLFKVK
ncbi:hypothetical protein C0J52_16879 [Blattella germanica]|nr:hypothetical protein C0J52_16879 [Blattella germanica]